MVEKDQIAPNEIFFQKIANEIFTYQLVLFIQQNFKKTLRADTFLSSMPIYIPKIKSDINVLMKYWRLKNSEISLAESYSWL